MKAAGASTSTEWVVLAAFLFPLFQLIFLNYDMFPQLFNATQEYWRKLDDLEARYQNNELSIEEVNLQVKQLMAELGMERRRSLGLTKNMLQNWLATQRESLVGLSAIALICYGWFLAVNAA